MMRFLLSCLFALSASAGIVERPVEYQAGEVFCEGWQAFEDENDSRRPAVLIVHQWTGISEHEKERARELAALGYNVLVADVYGKGIRPQPPAAGQEAGKYKKDRNLLRSHLQAGLKVLQVDKRTDAARVACIGYCFGGLAAIELARAGAPIKGAISFHGSLDSPQPQDGRNIRCRVLALHGADDPFVPPADLAAFEKEMKDAGVDYKLVQYPGAVHAFTQKAAGNDPSKGAAYHEPSDKASWEELKAFLVQILGS